MNEIQSFIAVMAALSVGAERMVELLKGFWPWLGQVTEGQAERYRQARVQLVAVVVGMIIAKLAGGCKLIPALKTSSEATDWFCVPLLGLLASGGSAMWNHALDIVGAIKSAKEQAVVTQSESGTALVPLSAVGGGPAGAPSVIPDVGAAANTPAGEKVGSLKGFIGQSQGQEFWCWAAVASSVSIYLANTPHGPSGGVWNQCDVASAVMKGSNGQQIDCCSNGLACDCPEELSEALTVVGHYNPNADYSNLQGTFPFETISQAIDQNCPVAARIGWWGGNDGHFLVITGYREDSNGQFVDVEDPVYGPKPGYSYTEFCASYRNAGQLTEIFVVS